MLERKLIALAASAALSACTVLDPDEPGNLVRETVDEDPSLPALAVNGTRLHVEMYGPDDAPVVIALHGGPGGDLAYQRALLEPVDGRRLLDDHRVVLWDQRGTGLSRRHGADGLSLAKYHGDLDALVDAVAPGRQVVLLGHSWGAAYAAAYMGRHPERVRGAVLMDMQALTRRSFEANPEPIDLDVTAEWLADPAWLRGLVTPDDHARADWWLASTLKTDLPRYHNHALVPNLRPGAAVFQVLNRDWDEDYDFTLGLEQVAPEVLLLGGEDDEVLGYAFQLEQARWFARARVEMVAGSGHNDFFTTRRDETNALVREYLDALPPEDRP